MPKKAEIGSIKDLNKRMKMRGLQKLKYYCQICEKQCRDANGFKCHLTSDNHLQQIQLFSKNATTRLDQYSTQFQKNFLDTLRMRHATSKVLANTVYQEMIQDKYHIHMNATIWTTLTDFVKYLGKHGYCTVEETERGWYITYIERNVQKLQFLEQQQLRQQAEQQAEYEMNVRIEQQQRHAALLLEQQQQKQHNVVVAAPTNLELKSNNNSNTESTSIIAPIQLSLKKNATSFPFAKRKKNQSTSSKSVFDVDDDGDDDEDIDDDNMKSIGNNPADVGTNSSNYEINSIATNNNNMKAESVTTTVATTSTIQQEQQQQQPPWLLPNIIVRIITKQLINNTSYYRQIGIVDSIVHNDPYVGRIRLIIDDDTTYPTTTTATNTTTKYSPPKVVIIQFDQDDLETVGPKHIPEYICMVRGPHRGRYGIVTQYNKKEYRATIELTVNNSNNDDTTTITNDRRPESNDKKITLRDVDYDDFSKMSK